ncbi:MAG: hypothetical protein OHK0021_25140 [Bryobacter sp.]
MKQTFLPLAAALFFAGQAFAGTWIEVTNGPGRINTYNGGGRFDATVYSSQNSTQSLGQLLVTCVDFLNVFSYGNRWEVNMTKLDGTDTLANTRYGGALTNNGNANNFDNYQGTYNALDRYRMAAWLTSQLPNYTSGSLNAKGIQGAIWYLLDPTGTPNAPISGTTGFAANRMNWLNQAVNVGLAQSASFFANYRVLTQVNVSWLGNGRTTRYQEFITVVTPEPSTYVALALALGFVVWMARRRKAGVTNAATLA